jgi:hypothetical protein
VPDRKGDRLKHDYTDASPSRPVLRRIHPGKWLSTPIIQIEIQQAIARPELCRQESSKLNSINKKKRFGMATSPSDLARTANYPSA